MASRTWTWLIPSRLNSTGSSAVMMLVSILLRDGDGRVERVGLARARGTRDEDDAVRLGDGPLEPLEGLLLEAELGHVEHQLRLVEKPHDDLLAPEGGQHRDAEVELAALVVDPHADLDAPVLRQALLGDVEPGHDLDARDERVAHLHGQGHELPHDAVHAETDPESPLVGLDVDVGGALLQRLDEEVVRDLDDGRRLARACEAREIDLVLFGLELLDVVVAAEGVEVFLGDRTDPPTSRSAPVSVGPSAFCSTRGEDETEDEGPPTTVAPAARGTATSRSTSRWPPRARSRMPPPARRCTRS